MRQYRGIGGFAIVFILLLVMIQNAWVSDDGYITLRVVENLAAGYGPVFNVGERVQVFTHPLWAGMLAAEHYVLLRVPAYQALQLPLYSLTIWSGLLLSALAVALFLWKVAPRRQAALLCLIVLGFSRSFIHYSTSGLENPLLHLITAAILAAILFRPNDTFLISLLVGLGLLARWDFPLAFGPYLIYLLAVSKDRKRTLLDMFAGLAPAMAWELYAIVYYGFPFPNTAYAKLATGLPRSVLFAQGWLYVEDLWVHDRLTFVTIAAGIAASLASREWPRRTLGAGLVLCLAFLCWRGGDFMSGRLFSPLLVLALGLLASAPLSSAKPLYGAAIAALAIGFTVPNPPFLRDERIGTAPRSDFVYKGEVTDERAYYYPRTGLLAPGKYYLRRQFPPPDRWVVDEAAYEVRELNDLGIKGYSAGPSVHVFDAYALADPLLARLPAHLEWSSIGHAARLLPDGYLESLQQRENLIVDPNLAEYYERLRLVVRGEVFDPRRLLEIARFNLGLNNALLRAYVAADE